MSFPIEQRSPRFHFYTLVDNSVVDFFKWFFNLFGKKKSSNLLLPPSKELIILKENTMIGVKELFLEAAKKAANERVIKEREFFTDERLHKAITGSIAYLIENMYTGKENILIGSSSANIPQEFFPMFIKIFIGVCKEVGLKTGINEYGPYITVGTISVRKLIEELQDDPIDVEEKIKNMLHVGVYR